MLPLLYLLPNMMKKTVLGIKIDDITSDEAIELVRIWLTAKKKRFIATPNPEFIVAAQKDEEFLNILNNADLSLPDGVGLKLAGVKNIVHGADFLEKLVEKTPDWKISIGFLGGEPGIAEKAAKYLKVKYPNIKLSFAASGGFVDNTGNMHTPYLIPYTDLLFVGIAYPKAEKWIYKNLDKLPVKVAMGVGGAFDFISGKVPRAPKFVQNLRLEWLFRLIIQPWRIKRQIALLKYLVLLLTSK